jgi:hypothetical protein
VLEAYVLKPDGAQIRSERAGDRLSFPGLDVGDYIVVRYWRNSRATGGLNQDFWGHSALNGLFPIYRKDMRIIYPESSDLTVQYHNNAGIEVAERTQIFEGEMQELYISVKNMEPVRYESGMPDWKDVLTWVDFSTIKNWGTITQWYRELYEGRCQITPKIRKKVHALTLDLTDNVEKIESIFDFVSREIEYEDLSFMYSAYVPEEAELVLEDGFGDCKDQCTLLITMLAAAGIDSFIALNTPDYRGEHYYLPSTRFTHSIVLVPMQEGNIILDPTTQHYSFPELPPSVVGSHYLPIPPSVAEMASELQKVSFQQDPTETYYIVEVEPSLESSSVSGTAIYGGFHAGYVRSLLLSNSPEYRKQGIGIMLQEGCAGFKLSTFEFENEDSLLTSPIVDFTGTTGSSLIQVDRDLFSLEIPWFVQLSPELLNIGLTTPRENNLQVSYIDLASPSRQVTVVDIPAGYELHMLPENAVFEYGALTISYEYEQKEDKLICERYVHVPYMLVAVQDLKGFNSVQEQIFRKEREKVLLRSTGR